MLLPRRSTPSQFSDRLPAVTMQLNRERLLDLFAQGIRRSALTDHWRVCSRITSCLAQKSATQPHHSQLHGCGSGESVWKFTANNSISFNRQFAPNHSASRLKVGTSEGPAFAFAKVAAWKHCHKRRGFACRGGKCKAAMMRRAHSAPRFARSCSHIRTMYQPSLRSSRFTRRSRALLAFCISGAKRAIL